MLVDTHCHLDAEEFGDDADALREQAAAAGVRLIVVPAVAPANFAAVRGLSGRRVGAHCVYALGIHPMAVDRAPEDAVARLRAELTARIDDPALVAVGEIGLDFFVPGLDRERQERVYVEQLALAREFELPVLLHVRRSQDIVLKHLRRMRPVGGIAHAFNGSHQQAQAFVDLGLALGIGGAMTFTRALQIRRLARDLDAHAFVLETDAPDISPAWRHPARNEPAQLRGIADALAEQRGLSATACADLTTRNACRVIPRLQSWVDRLAEPSADTLGPWA